MADSVTPSVQTANLTEPQSTIPLTTAPHVVPASTSAIRVPIGLLSAPAASQSPMSISDIPMPPLITTLGVGYIHPPKPTHDDEHRTAAFASRPSLRILSRDLSLVLHHLPSRLSRATLASALSSVSATCILAAARTWRPRWRARSRTVAARVFCIDAAVAEVVFTPPFRRLPRGPCWAHHP